MADLGVDVSTYTRNDEGELDLDPTGQEISGARVVAESVARGWETDPGSLPWAEDEGADLARYLNADLSDAEVLALSVELEADARRDERVAALDVSASFDARSGALSVSGDGITGDGPFQLVLSPDDLSIAAIKAGGA